MKNKLFGFGAAWATAMLLLVLCLFPGCQTAQAVRWDMNGIKRIAIDSRDSDIANSFSQKLTETEKYTVATEAELADWKRWRDERQAMEEKKKQSDANYERMKNDYEKMKTDHERMKNYYERAIRISAADLAKEYEANAVRADGTYSNKDIRITGVINEIGSSRGRYFMRLVGSGKDSVILYFNSSETSKVASVNKGQTITVIGKCKGRNPTDNDDIAEIRRTLGGGDAVIIDDATFPVTLVAPAVPALGADNYVLKDYTGPVDAIITLNASLQEIGLTALMGQLDLVYSITRARNGSSIGDGREPYMPSGINTALDKIIEKMVSSAVE